MASSNEITPFVVNYNPFFNPLSIFSSLIPTVSPLSQTPLPPQPLNSHLCSCHQLNPALFSITFLLTLFLLLTMSSQSNLGSLFRVRKPIVKRARHAKSTPSDHDAHSTPTASAPPQHLTTPLRSSARLRQLKSPHSPIAPIPLPVALDSAASIDAKPMGTSTPKQSPHQLQQQTKLTGVTSPVKNSLNVSGAGARKTVPTNNKVSGKLKQKAKQGKQQSKLTQTVLLASKKTNKPFVTLSPKQNQKQNQKEEDKTQLVNEKECAKTVVVTKEEHSNINIINDENKDKDNDSNLVNGTLLSLVSENKDRSHHVLSTPPPRLGGMHNRRSPRFTFVTPLTGTSSRSKVPSASAPPSHQAHDEITVLDPPADDADGGIGYISDEDEDDEDRCEVRTERKISQQSDPLLDHILDTFV